jgi:twitching motility two-component system response regulator PilH
MSNPATNKKILIIEDDPDIRLGYQVLLRGNNFETFFAADGMTAISEARKVQPDLIVLDLGLPAGDGFVVLGRLKTNLQLALIPVIVVSGRDFAVSKAKALKEGARAFLQKPWDDAELLSTINRLLGQPEGAAATAQARAQTMSS